MRVEHHALVQRVAETAEFQARLSALGKGAVVCLDHVTPEATAFATALVIARARQMQRRLWVLCPDVRVQDHVHAELLVWQCPALYFPRQIQQVGEALPDPDSMAERVSVLGRWGGGQVLNDVSLAGNPKLSETNHSSPSDTPTTLLLCADSLDETVPAASELESQRRMIEVGAQLDVEAFIGELGSAGYERVPVVMERGQFARRGGIVDFFSYQAEEPLRVEWLDDEIESIRAFDLHNQSSIRRLDRAGVILQISESATETGRVRDYLHQDDLVLVIGTAGIPCHARILTGALPDEWPEDYSTAIHENPLGVFDASDFVLHEARRKQFEMQLHEWKKLGWKTVIFFHNEAERERFAELRSPEAGKDTETQLGLLYRGFTVPAARLAVLTGAEIFGRHQHTRRVRGSKLDDPETLRKARDVLRELRDGDLVVHGDHGVARYAGIEMRTSPSGKKEEVLVLHYADQAKLFVPVAQAHMVTRYVGVGGKAPALSKLGGASWQKTRRSAEKSVEEFAAKMLSISAERRTVTGYAHPHDTKWQVEFEQSFLYRETPDQLRCVEEIKRDMEAPKPMERLLCADVGFGKTEVAVRAAFKCVQDGKQVAILVPTTLLASQHGNTFSDRFAGYPIRVEVISRFLTAAQAKKVIAGLATGEIDCVIGTHRLLQDNIKFKDLGLLVVDEEQRFGVTHKEAMKQLKTNVDVLTLTATPIPRTLEMSLVGIRDLSLLQTPPADRQPILTFVGEHDERVATEAIRRELLRDGQVFWVHNRVQSIEDRARELRELVPEARIAVAHGQMDEATLEQTVIDFWEGKYDVLVCTTIIESGIDMPTVNTLVVERADLLGLGQLHQLRGRVGRSGSRAYAYLFHPRDRVLSEDAYERLKTIGEATELGSGFKIAMRDLEIRGAGNLLGEAQSGHIAAVGYDLYCQLVTEAVAEMKGEEVPSVVPELKLDVPTNAFLPTDYVAKEESRLDAYRRLAAVTSIADVEDIRNEWLDRYGPLPQPALALINVGLLRAESHRLGLRELVVADGRARMLPISLKASEVMRLQRIAKNPDWNEKIKQLVVTLPRATNPKIDDGATVTFLVGFLQELVEPAN